MSFENLRLPAALVHALYRNSLVDTAPAQPAIPGKPGEHIPVKYLGNNARRILILVNEPADLYVSDADLQFLTGILGACKLGMADVALININQVAAIFPFGLNADKVLLFGVEPATINLPVYFPHYQVQSHGPQQFLAGPPLHELAGNKQLKQQLWESLKKLFNL